MAASHLEDIGSRLVVAAGAAPDVRGYWKAVAGMLLEWLGATRVAIEYADEFGAGTVYVGTRASGLEAAEQTWNGGTGREVHARVTGASAHLADLQAALPIASELATLVGHRAVMEHERRLGRFLVELSQWMRIAPSDPHRLLQYSLQTATALSDADGAFLSQRRNHHGAIDVLATAGHGDWFTEAGPALQVSFVARTMDRGQPFISERLANEVDLPFSPEQRARLRAAVCIPFDTGGDDRIALCVFRIAGGMKGETPFPPNEVTYLSGVTAHVGAALEIAHALQNARQAAQRASAMVNASPLPLALVNEDGIVTQLNRAWATLFGNDIVETGVGGPLHDFAFTLDKATPDEALRAATTGVPWRGRAEAVRNGEQRHCDAVFTALPDRRYLVALHDRTEEILAHRELVSREKLATIGEIAGGVAHEINNPLAAIRMEAELIAMAESDSEVERSVKVIINEVDRAARIARSLLRLARPADGGLEQIPIQTLIADVVEVRSRVVRADGIEMTAEIAPDLPDIPAHSGELEQVLMHVVTNAEYAVRGRKNARIVVRAEPLLGGVRIIVDDSGPGVPADLKERIFDPFFTTKPPNQATGLGLPLSRRIADDLGGSLTLTDSPLGGARFVLDLPGAVA